MKLLKIEPFFLNEGRLLVMELASLIEFTLRNARRQLADIQDVQSP